MYNNLYIKYNYRNIIPFNLKKKKLRVHANIIANKIAQSFFVGHQVKFWYYFFGINGLKRDNTILVKKFLNKKLSVFFISKFNMIEGKWGFPKIYEKYYQKYSYLKNKKFNLIKSKLVLNKDCSDYNLSTLNYNFDFSKSKLFYKNIFYLKYIYFMPKISYLQLYKNSLNTIHLFKFEKKYKMPYLFIRTIRKRRKLKKDFDFNEKKKVYFRKKHKIAINSHGVLHIYKKKNVLKNLINESYILLKKHKIKNKMLQWKWNIFMKRNINFKWNLKKNINNLEVKINNNIVKHQAQQNRIKNKFIVNSEKPIFDKKLYFKNKWFKEQKRLFEAEEYIKKKKKILIKKKILLKFVAIKKIMSIIRILKLFKELKKNANLGTICYWFYKCFINFKFNTLSKKFSLNKKIEKKVNWIKKSFLLLKKINKRINKQINKKLKGKQKRRFVSLKFLKKKLKNRVKFNKIGIPLLKKKKNIWNNLFIKKDIRFHKIINYRNKKIKFFSNKVLNFDIKHKKNKKILYWIIYLYNKLHNGLEKKIYINFIIKLNKILINLYKFKIFDNIYFDYDKNLFLNKTNVYYNFLGEMFNECSNFSRGKRLKLLKNKKTFVIKKSNLFKKMRNLFKKRKKKFNVFSFLCRHYILLSGEDRILHKFKGSKFGGSLRKIWNTYLLKGKKLWLEDEFLIFSQNRTRFFNYKNLNYNKKTKWHRYLFNAADLQTNFKINFLRRNKNIFNKKKKFSTIMNNKNETRL